MRPNLEELQSSKYVLLEKVRHTEFNTFLDSRGWKNAFLKLIYRSILLAFLVLTVTQVIQFEASILTKLLFTAIGFIAALLILPLHELLHMLAYKFFGAPNVRIHLYLSRAYILAKADQFVVGKRELIWIALIPFIIITAGGLLILLITGGIWSITTSALLLFHTSICQADFRIVDYCIDHEGKVFMYDNLEQETTYFYRTQ